jgi:hypothetical protein
MIKIRKRKILAPNTARKREENFLTGKLEAPTRVA